MQVFVFKTPKSKLEFYHFGDLYKVEKYFGELRWFRTSKNCFSKEIQSAGFVFKTSKTKLEFYHFGDLYKVEKYFGELRWFRTSKNCFSKEIQSAGFVFKTSKTKLEFTDYSHVVHQNKIDEIFRIGYVFYTFEYFLMLLKGAHSKG